MHLCFDSIKVLKTVEWRREAMGCVGERKTSKCSSWVRKFEIFWTKFVVFIRMKSIRRGVSVVTVQRIIHENMDMSKVCVNLFTSFSLTNWRKEALVITGRRFSSLPLIQEYFSTWWPMTRAWSTVMIQRLRVRVPRGSLWIVRASSTSIGIPLAWRTSNPTKSILWLLWGSQKRDYVVKGQSFSTQVCGTCTRINYHSTTSFRSNQLLNRAGHQIHQFSTFLWSSLCSTSRRMTSEAVVLKTLRRWRETVRRGMNTFTLEGCHGASQSGRNTTIDALKTWLYLKEVKVCTSLNLRNIFDENIWKNVGYN